MDLDDVAAEVAELLADDLAGGGVVEAAGLELRHPLLGVAVAQPVGAVGPAERPGGGRPECLAPPLQAAQFLPTTIAIRVPGLPQNDVICQIEFFCATRSGQPVQMPVWIHDRAASGAPQSPIESGTMLVGTNPGSCVAPVQAPVQANTDFFVVFDNAVGNLRPPVLGYGNYGTGASEHWHSGPPNWVRSRD